jgi:HK97 family phage prohead protease
MTELAVLRQEAAAARAAAAGGGTRTLGIPDQGSPRSQKVQEGAQLRAEKITKDGQEWFRVEGYASVFETPYEMWDQFGPYMEVVSTGAADTTLSASPHVIFRFNHDGHPMANTRNGRLELSADDTGLHMRALLNPTRDDVRLLMQALEDQDVTEQSFMFTIDAGIWSPDYTEYRIEQFDLERGDVGPVTYGANPYTSIAARSGEILADLRRLPRLAAREALQILNERDDVAADRGKALDEELAVAVAAETRTVEDFADETTVTTTKPLQFNPLPKREGRSVAMLRAMLNADDEL